VAIRVSIRSPSHWREFPGAWHGKANQKFSREKKTPVNIQKAMENGPFIVHLPIKNGDFP
jgi:hypothetical protein